MEEWMQYARDMAKAEKELKIELWVIISFYRTTEQGGKVLLFRYDLPRKVADKYDWVVRWRRARLTCQYPKGNVTHTYCLYDRHSGEDYSFGSCLSSGSQGTGHQDGTEDKGIHRMAKTEQPLFRRTDGRNAPKGCRQAQNKKRKCTGGRKKAAKESRKAPTGNAEIAKRITHFHFLPQR